MADVLVVEDKLSMAHGLETRVPFLDNDLVDFFAAVPHELRIAQNLYIQTAKTRLFSGGEDGLAGIRRIGSRSMAVDSTLRWRIRRLQGLQPFKFTRLNSEQGFVARDARRRRPGNGLYGL